MNKAFLNTAAKIQPTLKLFHNDPYCTGATAKVLFVEGDIVVTDQSIFYAESGGQIPDQGEIDGIPVIDVQKQGGKTLRISHPKVEVPQIPVDTFIVHQLDRPAPFHVGQELNMKINWPVRYLNMRYHGAAHFLYQAVRTVLPIDGKGPTTRGCYIHSEGARFDYFEPIPAESISEIECVANELINKNASILMEKEPTADNLMYWIYNDIIIPCGGTHVRLASEIGPIKVNRKAKGKNNTRVSCTLTQV
jgi:alanyl-tRNA synthetase